MAGKKELVLRLLDRITIDYKIPEGIQYSVDICSNGLVQYTTPNDEGNWKIDPVEAKYLLQEESEDLFLMDSDVEGTPSPESYHWTVSFYTKKGLVRTMEGWQNEPSARYEEFNSFLGELSDYAGEDLGAYALEKQARRKAKAQENAEIFERAKTDGEKKATPEGSSITALSQKLLCHAASESDPRANLLISPLSIEIVLYMLAHASQGQSREELLNYLGIDSEELLENVGKLVNTAISGKAVAAANALFADEATMPYILPEFIGKMSDTAATEILSFKAGATRRINSWVKEKTRGMIPSLLSPESKVDNLAILNAVSFEAKWRSTYDYTESGAFHRLDGGTEKAEYLNSIEHYLIYDEAAIGFMKPYARSDYMFMGLLPQKTKDPAEFIKSLEPDTLGKYIRNAAKLDVRVSFPEFSFDSSLDLKKVLSSNGVNCIFDSKTADISKMLSIPDSFISDIIHKTHIEVDRNGTKAAAVTAALVCAGCCPLEPYCEVRFNRPFVFGLIHRETGLPLFLGIVNTVNG